MTRKIRLTQVNEMTNTFKAYEVTMRAGPDGWAVSGWNGRIGSALNEQPKGVYASEAEAGKAFDKLVASKVRGGYRVDGEAADMALPETREVMTDMIPMRPTAIDESDLADMMSDRWLVQRKHDGENRPIMLDKRDIVLTNRLGNPVPAPAALVEDLKMIRDAAGLMILDSEDLGADGIVIFDIRAAHDIIPDSPFARRNEALRSLRDVISGLSLRTRILVDVAEPLPAFLAANDLRSLREGGVEGVVIKDARAPYAPGRTDNPAAAATLKVKFTEDATFRVAPGRDAAKRSVGVESLDPATGEWERRGNVTIPANAEIPAEGALIDVNYLYVTGAHGALVQPVFKRVRDDAVPEDCDVGRLKLKGGGYVRDVMSGADASPSP